MKKITIEACRAFGNSRNWKKGNTQVTHNDGVTCMFLFGNKIAEMSSTGLDITSAGWYSDTTKERLNGILDNFGYSIFQKKYKWFVEKPDGVVIPYFDGMGFIL